MKRKKRSKKIIIFLLAFAMLAQHMPAAWATEAQDIVEETNNATVDADDNDNPSDEAGSNDQGSGTGSSDQGSGTGSSDQGSGTGSNDQGSGTGSNDQGSGTGNGNQDGEAGSGAQGDVTGSDNQDSGTGSNDQGSGTGSDNQDGETDSSTTEYNSEQSTTTQAPADTEQNTTTQAPVSIEQSTSAQTPVSSGQSTGSGQTTTQETTEENPRESYTVKQKPYDDKNRIEQVQIIKPKVRSYLYIEDSGYLIDETCILGTLGASELETVSVENWKQSGMGINYYVILDVSRAMDEEYFEEVKKQIGLFGKKYMTQGDTLTVYTVGGDDDTGTPIIKGASKNDADAINEQLDEIEIGGDGSELYLGIQNAAYDIHKERLNREEDFLDNRDIVIAFSSGGDVLGDETTGSDATDALKKEGITLFCFIWEDESGETEAEELIRLSSVTGGTGYETEADELAEAVNRLIDSLQDVYVVDFMAEDNISDMDYSTFSVAVYIDEKEEIWEYSPRDVMVSRSIRDDTPPIVEDISLTDDNCIEIAYSESVLGANDVAAYRLVKEDGTELTAASVAYMQHNVYRLSFAENDIIYKGSYTLFINGVTDNTVEKNALEITEYAFEPENAPEYKEKDGVLARFWWLFLAGAAVLVIIISVIVIVVQNKKKNEIMLRRLASSDESDEDARADRNKIGERDEQLEALTNEPGRKITLIVNSEQLKNKRIDVGINGSIIVGRSDLCDVFLADECLSRQHFAIEYDGDSFYVEDLDTTNGTILNGAKLSHKRRLEKNDKISIGTVNIVVRW